MYLLQVLVARNHKNPCFPGLHQALGVGMVPLSVTVGRGLPQIGTSKFGV